MVVTSVEADGLAHEERPVAALEPPVGLLQLYGLAVKLVLDDALARVPQLHWVRAVGRACHGRLAHHTDPARLETRQQQDPTVTQSQSHSEETLYYRNARATQEQQHRCPSILMVTEWKHT